MNRYYLTRIFARPEGANIAPLWSIRVFCSFRHDDLGFADEESLERARGVVPPEALPVSVPHLEAVLLLAVLVFEVVRLSGVVVAVGDGAAGGHPEELSLLALVRARRPEVLVSHADGLDVFLQVPLLVR